MFDVDSSYIVFFMNYFSGKYQQEFMRVALRTLNGEPNKGETGRN